MARLLLHGVDVLGRGVRELAVVDDRLIDADHVVPGDVGWQHVDCTGLVGLPALVDMHTHLRDPGVGDAETIESGSRAAAAGGYGAICPMANTTPVADTVEVVEYEQRRGREIGLCDVYPVGALTRGLLGDTLADLAGMAHSRARVRMFSDDGQCLSRSDLVWDAMTRLQPIGAILAQHCQDPALTVGAQVDDGPIAHELGMPGWPGAAETAIIARDAVLAGYLGARLHVCHVSTAAGVAAVRWAKDQGWPVTAEASPHHLTLTSELTLSGDPVFKVNPPLRSVEDVAAVQQGLVDGTIDVVATDHAPHADADKARPWSQASSGMLGLQTAVSVLAEAFIATGRLGWAQLAQSMSDTPAQLLGISAAHGGDLRAGRPASLCLVDPGRAWTVTRDDLASIAHNSPFIGRTFGTRVVATLLRGVPTYDLDGRFPAEQ